MQELPFFRPLLLFLLLPAVLEAQTDFHNVDHGRPLRVEDAYPVARHAFELHGSPLTASQRRSGELEFAPALALTYGVLPGVDLGLGSALEVIRDEEGTTTTLDGLEATALVNLWVEGPRLPAVAIRVEGQAPFRSERRATGEARLVLTRSLVGPVRLHANAGVAMGSEREESGWVGVAMDYVRPFEHLLVLAELWMAEPQEGRRRIHSGVGFRWQLSRTVVLDAGIGRDWSGERRRDWTGTIGIAHEFGLRALHPGARR